ncbi:uncharacterized protein LOC134216709 [Armigeres subalbatus]|uniref:uncharacterized protein LOC134216709 n=1 Tax=Armigeres subalbatus TaxID=124917 RepID=UPI002ED60F4C
MEQKNMSSDPNNEMALEYALLASPEADSIVQEAAENIGMALNTGSKRPANSPTNGDDKRQRVAIRNQLKLMIRRENADVDDEYFHKLSGEIFYRQGCLTSEFLPTFYNSGHTNGIGWFCACDESSLTWLKSTLDDIKRISEIKDFIVMPYAPIPQLRRTIFSIPHFEKFEKGGNEKVMTMITRLNRNFDTKFWKVATMLPPANGMRSIIMNIDEESVVKLAKQGNKLFYGLSQVFVKVYPKHND